MPPTTGEVKDGPVAASMLVRMIFKAYDIRGIVPAELDPDIAYGIGRATAHYLEADPIGKWVARLFPGAD